MNIQRGFPIPRGAMATTFFLVLMLVVDLSSAPAASGAPGPAGEEEFEGKKKDDKDKKEKDKDSEEDAKKSDEKGSGDSKTPKKGADKKDADKKDADKKDDGKTQVDAAKKEYVHRRIKDYLFPTSFRVLDDGRVELSISFREKKEEHAGIFSRKFGASMRDPFRYTIDQEEIVVGGDVGLRLSDRGEALINCWFQDDVEAEMEYLQYVTHNQRLIGAIVFCTDKKRALGSNFGNQCVQFRGGRMSRPKGKSQAVSFNQTARIKLAVRKGVYEAHRQGKKMQSAKYTEKYYESGRIGFVWGGSTAVIVPSVKITGRLDYDTMEEKLKEYFAE